MARRDTFAYLPFVKRRKFVFYKNVRFRTSLIAPIDIPERNWKFEPSIAYYSTRYTFFALPVKRIAIHHDFRSTRRRVLILHSPPHNYFVLRRTIVTGTRDRIKPTSIIGTRNNGKRFDGRTKNRILRRVRYVDIAIRCRLKRTASYWKRVKIPVIPELVEITLA